MHRITRRIVAAGVGGLVIAITIGAGTLVAMSKSVAISVDGEITHVTTLAGNVAGALADAGITVSENDTLAPAPNQRIADGSQIQLQRGRLVSLDIDGTSTQWWTTATTLDAAMAELGRDPRDFELSADRSRSIPLTGLTVSAQTLLYVSIVDAQRPAIDTITTVDTVGDLLVQSEIALGKDDLVTPAVTEPVVQGMTVTVDRVSYQTRKVNRKLPQPAATTVPDETLAVGTKKVQVKGNPGKEQITYRITLINGVEVETEKVGTKVITKPKATLVHLGTKEPEPPKPDYTMVGNRVFFNDFEFGVNWDGLAKCESTNNPRAVDPSGRWYGLFQFDFSTWRSVGGSGNPADADPMEQLMRAKLLYQSRGLQPWLCAHAA